jgi:tetratricopeptide (TPR) repeat protein
MSASPAQRRAYLRGALENGDHDRALEIARLDIELVRDLAASLQTEIKPQLSMAARRIAIEASPTNVTLHLEFVRALFMARKLEMVIEHLSQCSLDDAARRQVLLDLGDQFLAENRPKHVGLTLDTLVKLAPNDPDLHRLVTRMSILQMGSDQAVERLRTSELPLADKSAILRHVATAFDSEGRSDRALDCRRAAITFAPQDRELTIETVRQAVMVKDFAAAMEILDGGSLDSETKTQIVRDLGGEFMSTGRRSLALQCREEALTRSPQNQGVVFEIINALILVEGVDAARQFVARSPLPSGAFVQTLRDLAGKLTKSGHHGLAITSRRMAYNLEPGNKALVHELVRSQCQLATVAEGVRELDFTGFSLDDRVDILRDLGSEFLEARQSVPSLSCYEAALDRAPASCRLNFEWLHAVAVLLGEERIGDEILRLGLSPIKLANKLDQYKIEMDSMGRFDLAHECHRLRRAPLFTPMNLNKFSDDRD